MKGKKWRVKDERTRGWENKYGRIRDCVKMRKNKRKNNRMRNGWLQNEETREWENYRAKGESDKTKDWDSK